MTKQDSVYLKHILDAISCIEEYAGGIDFEDFVSNKMVQDAVIRQIEIIGEASKRLSLEFKAGHRGIPWEDIAGMRDKLAHDYLGVNMEQVWLTVEKDIPNLQHAVSLILSKQQRKQR